MTPTDSSGAVSRRGLIIGAAGVGGVVAAGAAGYALAPVRVKRFFGIRPDFFVPDAPEGQVRLETVWSKARGMDVDLFTAVPDGYGDGAGLPVVVILHGGSARAEGFQEFGFGRFLTQAVLDGAQPFVLAGADGGLLRWEPDPASSDDPQAMVVREMPRWLSERGFDVDRRALWGWSMGGYGCLRLAETQPGWASAVAAFSPAVNAGDAVFADVDRLADLPLGLWCGTDDGFYPAVQDLVSALPTEPVVVEYTEGEAHTRTFWSDQTLEAFAFLAAHL